jgi:hypothetical protein
MAIDIYFKLPSDSVYDPRGIEEESALEIFLQQVDMILTTERGSVLGDPEFGLNLEKYLWSYSGGSGTIQQEINQQIINYVYIEGPIDYEISVSFISGEIWDTILIDVLIDGEKIAGYMMAP